MIVMTAAMKKSKTLQTTDYGKLLGEITGLLDEARRQSARSVNAILTTTYWLVGWRIVEFEQAGEVRATYGASLLKQLSSDLSKRFGRGFSERNLEQMRLFYISKPISQTVSAKSLRVQIPQTASAKSGVMRRPVKVQTVSAQFTTQDLMHALPLPWSHYVLLLSVESEDARRFYEYEALRNGWSVRQLDRQISTQFYERTLLSKNKAAMLRSGAKARKDEIPTAEEEIKNPLVLEFLGLKDEYSESELEEALIAHLEKFLLELGGDFTFVGRQRRLRIGNEWYRIDLLFFHRKLRCLVVIDLKVGKFTHADAGQMHLYLNYARTHWTNGNENPPVGLILCAQKNSAVAKYALEGLPNKILAAEYKLALPDEAVLIEEVKQTQKRIESRRRKR